MIKIFLTGDNHIGKKYNGHKESKRLAEVRTDALKKMVSKANDEACDIFAITGDLFDNLNSVSKKEIDHVMNSLSAFDGHVLILPGNHDYYDENSKFWSTVQGVIKDMDNILLLKEHKPYELNVRDEPVIIYPAFCQTKHSEENNLSWIVAENIQPDETVRIGMAHGALEGLTIDKEGKYFLMKQKELEAIPVDLWLIGHTHIPFPSYLKIDKCSIDACIFNAGTHVQTDVNNNTLGNCFIIEIEEGKGKKKIYAKTYLSGPIRFVRKIVKINQGDSLKSALAKAFEDIDDETCVDVVLSGAIVLEEYEKRDEIITNALKRFIEGTYNDDELSRLITKSAIEKEFAETSFVAQLLNELLDEPKEAQMLYELLNTDN